MIDNELKKHIDSYGLLYDIVKENMDKTGNAFEYSRETFLADVGQAPEEIDIGRLLFVPDKDFAKAAYMVCTSREPGETTINELSKKAEDNTREEFQKAVLANVWSSLLMALNHATFINNPYFKTKLGLKHKFIYILSQIRRNRTILKILQKMPKGIINMGRKLVG